MSYILSHTAKEIDEILSSAVNQADFNELQNEVSVQVKAQLDEFGTQITDLEEELKNKLSKSSIIGIQNGGTSASNRASALHNLSFISKNTNDMTPSQWFVLGNGWCWYDEDGCLTNQPTSKGFLINLVYQNEVSQIFLSGEKDNIYSRKNNNDNWDDWVRYVSSKEIGYIEVNLPVANWDIPAEAIGKMNTWRWRKYASLADQPTLELCENAPVVAEEYHLESQMSYEGDFGSSYTALYTTYVMCQEGFSMTFNITTDDNGAVYLNGNHLIDVPSCETVAVDFDFLKGINKIDICYTEGSGGDGCSVSPLLSTIPEISSFAGSLGAISQTVAVDKLSEGWIPGTPILVPSGNLLNDTDNLQKLQNLLMEPGDNSIVFTMLTTTPPSSDLTIRIPGIIPL